MTTYSNLQIHFIWSIKNREPLIHKNYQDDLFAYMGGILRDRKHVLRCAGGVADHVHLLVSVHPQQSISDLVRDVKTNSSSWVHQTQAGLRGFAWQAGYGAFSVSHSSLPQVAAYIAGQEEHHRTRTFQEEFLKFLERHRIDYDERYVWS